tara:strand:+ start:1371 stop:2288 length:918 start_codon:yes stop_codon:yes gene_type:complete
MVGEITGNVDGITNDKTVGQQTGGESSLSNWAGDYVTDMLGKGQALGNEGYNAYTGPLTADSSGLQDAAFEGLGGLANTFTTGMGTGGYTPQEFTGANVGQYMNPYLTQALQPQIAAAQRQGEIDRINNASRMTQAGSFGGSRQAVAEAGLSRGLGANLANITGQGYRDAYDNATNQFNTAQDRRTTAQSNINEYGISGLQSLADLGTTQRDIESEGITADRLQFEEERDFPYKQVQYMQSLLQGMPITAQSYSYAKPSELSELLASTGGIQKFIELLYPDETSVSASAPAPAPAVTKDITAETA